MKVIFSAMFGLLVYSGVTFAGGSIGGGGGSVQLEMPELDSLSRVYVDGSDYRRLNARLSVGGVEKLPVVIGNEAVELKKLQNRVVDLNVSREFLPFEGGTVGGGGSGVVSFID
jgi:hypothetical protein